MKDHSELYRIERAPANNFLFAGGPPANNFLFAGGPPANKFLFAGGPQITSSLKEFGNIFWIKIFLDLKCF